MKWSRRLESNQALALIWRELVYKASSVALPKPPQLD